MDKEVYQRICALLSNKGIPHRTVSHAPTSTSEESAKARGEDLKIGGKALLLKVGADDFRLFVMSAVNKLDSKAIKQFLAAKKVRFATAEELFDLTGLVPGSVPPFGLPILPFPLYVDTSITINQKIAFNAGSLTDSVVLAVDDYLQLAKPEIFTFSSAPEESNQ